MNWNPLKPLLFTPVLGLIACSSSGLRIVEANPDLMYELGGNRSGEIVILEGDKPVQKKGSRYKSRGLRLPNMVDLPTNKELDSNNSGKKSSSGGVISRPPVD